MPGSTTAQLPTQTLYCYLNSTHKVQIVCLINSDGVLLEKVVFPRQRFVFESIPEGRLEIYVGQKGKKVLQKVIYCRNLSVEDSEPQLTAI
ncbi:MAG: DUF1830 domain-containing protein [Cyanobacteria bacterium P01_G01_bin.19]